jgi:glycine cleavage system H protein
MEGFTYNNIFETKGIEYLVIISFFAILIPFWLLLNRKVKLTQQISKVVGLITAGSLRIPQGVFFSKFHTWAHLGTNGEARVGLDDLLLHFTGDVNFEHIKSPGEHIKKGEVLTLINHNGKNLRILSPISGEIKSTNASLGENPGLIKEDPYGQGWIYSIKPIRWKAETNSYYLAEEATYWAKQELLRFKDFLSVSVTKYMPEPGRVVLQDGGELIDQPLAELPQEVWQEFQDKFLT